ncbi:S-adenosyl-L-methionine-dependent methyltransferase [Xylariaceae sp. FL1651]|nr:S-adenosyl-L-methionine-dependent methyltransferase [Xylariaceae sp. FL1651]
MFTICSHGRAIVSPLLVHQRFLSSTCRRSVPKGLDKTILNAQGPVAEQLAATSLWIGRGSSASVNSPSKVRASAPSKPNGDKSRINVVSDKLCDDIFSYIGPSLERHRGCDILDIYPGAGLWSRKLHEYLQPRSHVLMEPDAELYRPFLQPLLDQPGTALVPESGIIWRELNSVLTPEYLTHQAIPKKQHLNRRNDTLLVTANLAFHPPKRFHTFDSIANLVLHQFINAIRTNNLFHRYGLVRMLIWTRCDDKWSFLPKAAQRRRRQSIENDLLCEWVHEVCGNEESESHWYVREDAINNASLLGTVKRMRAANIQLPSERAPEGFQEAMAAVQARKRSQMLGKYPPVFKRAYKGVLADLEAADAEQDGLVKGSADFKSMKRYHWRSNSDVKKAQRLLQLWKSLDKIVALRKAGKATAEEVASLEAEWRAEVRNGPKGTMNEFVTYKDNLHLFRQTPPVLQWDRRLYEPMEVQAEEFFPNVNCSLLDIQPKKPHPLLRQTGPQTNRAADFFDVLMASLMSQGVHPLGSNLDSLWPGASDYILPRWTSVQDLSHGGFLMNLPYAEPTPRLLNARQWEQLLELWMEWPFRPEFHELVGRMQDDPGDRFDDSNPDA